MISSSELASWINHSPAMYQVLVIDACNSLEEDVSINSRIKGLASSQIKNLHTLKDLTGMNILMGSSSDKTSFESSKFGQGLMTYSLLMGMNHGALRDDKMVDIGKLIHFASEQVVKFAKGNRKIQAPQLLTGANFDLGLVDENVHIQVGKKRPIFIRSNFQNKELFIDNLKLGRILNRYLSNLSENEGEFLFIDVEEYKNAYHIEARYFTSPEKVNVQGKFFKGSEFLGDFNVTGGHPSDLENVVERILEKIAVFIIK